MCGIFFYFDKQNNLTVDCINTLNKHSELIKHRGPDVSNTYICDRVYIKFHQLLINGGLHDNTSVQPLINDRYVLVVNGEIYNYERLIKKYGINNYETKSDCEIILHLLNIFNDDLYKVINELDGEFACVLYDKHNNNVFAFRDQLGVRPLYISNDINKLVISSEPIAMTFVDTMEQLQPRCYYNMHQNSFTPYYYLEVNPSGLHLGESFIIENIRSLLINSVSKKMMGNREMGCLLSGGIDSSIVAAIYSKLSNKRIRTFTIGNVDSADIIAARVVAEHINSIHTEFIVTNEELLCEIDETIKIIGSYDITTIRASCCNRLLIKKINEQFPDIKVLFGSDVSDELFGGYRYFKYAPSAQQFHQETIRLLSDIHHFDGLRTDRCVSQYGIELRLPYFDKYLLEFVLHLDPTYKLIGERIEKYLLRVAFIDLLPINIIFRKKDAFSDAISSSSKLWCDVISDYVNDIVDTDQVLDCNINKPISKESFYYRRIFQKYYGPHSNLTPYYWLPKWIETNEPSAHKLSL